MKIANRQCIERNKDRKTDSQQNTQDRKKERQKIMLSFCFDKILRDLKISQLAENV